MHDARAAIRDGSFDRWSRDWLERYFAKSTPLTTEATP
jgi:hypothetical protein